MTQLLNTIALVTGAASGIGRLLSTELAEQGARVVLWDIDEQGANDVCSELIDAGYDAYAYGCDMSDRDNVARVAQRVRDDVGDVGILINNAGIVSGAPLMELSDAQIERTFAVNTLGLFWATRAFLGPMLQADRGHIVTIASAGGIAGTAKLTDYCASKFAAVGFDDSLRAELNYLDSKVTTTVVCPYYINTGMFDGVSTRFPWLLPILDPHKVTARIIRAVVRNQRRVVMPWFVYTSWLIRVLPVTLADRLLQFFGITESMDKFKGRAR